MRTLEQDAVPADWKPAKRRQKDTDASWTKKHGKSYHGYKFTVSVDRKHKLIWTWVADTASVHDSQHLEVALDEWNHSAEIYADKGYVGVEREDRLQAQGYRLHIQRKAKREKPLSACQERRNRRIAKVRARVEHVFAAIHPVGWQADPQHRSGPGFLCHGQDCGRVQHASFGLLVRITAPKNRGYSIKRSKTEQKLGANVYLTTPGSKLRPTAANGKTLRLCADSFVVLSPPVVLTAIRSVRAVICGSCTCTLRMSTWVSF